MNMRILVKTCFSITQMTYQKGYGTALTKKKNRMAVASKRKTYMYSSFPEMPRKL